MKAGSVNSESSSSKQSPPSPWISGNYDALLHPSKLDEVERESSQMSHSSGLNNAGSRLTFWISTCKIIAAVVGVTIGFLMRLRREPYNEREIMYASILSDCFNSSLRCIFVPLVVSNVFLILSQLNFKLCTRIARRAFVFILWSNLCATIVGMTIAIVLNPGDEAKGRVFEPIPATNTTIAENFLFTIINTVTVNFLPACLFQSSAPTVEMRQYSGVRSLAFEPAGYDLVPSTNFSGLLFLTFVYGLCASRVQNRLKVLPLLTETFSELSTLVVKLIAILSPLGILSSMISIVLQMPSWEKIISYLAIYFTSIIIGVLIHMIFVINLMHFVIVRNVPVKLFLNVIDIVVVAMCTPMSMYAVPYTMTFLHDRSYIDNRVVNLVIPLAAGYHKPACAIMYSVSTIFVARASGVSFNLIDLMRLTCLAFLFSMAESGFPEASTVFVQGAVKFIGADPSPISLILPVQPIVCAIANACNVFCDCVCASAVHSKVKEDIRNQDRIRRSRKKFRTSAASVIRTR